GERMGLSPTWAAYDGASSLEGIGTLPFQTQCDPGPATLAIGAPESWGPGPFPPNPGQAYATWDDYRKDVEAGLACWPYDDFQTGEIRAGLARVKECWPCQGMQHTMSGPGSWMSPGTAARLQQSGVNPFSTPWIQYEQSPADLQK